MKTSTELFQIAIRMKTMKPGVIVGYLNAVYKEGYKEGHAACCDEIGLEEGDKTFTYEEDEFLKALSGGNEAIYKFICKNYAKIREDTQ